VREEDDSTMHRRPGALLALAAALAALAGPSAGGATRPIALPHTLHVGLTEWAVVPSQGLVAAGPLRLDVRNYGRLRHQLEIVATDSWGSRLPIHNGRAVGPVVPGSVVVRPGGLRSLHVYLSPGSYVLLDNIRGHYDLGAAVAITVA
jgi:hypothetical protein